MSKNNNKKTVKRKNVVLAVVICIITYFIIWFANIHWFNNVNVGRRFSNQHFSITLPRGWRETTGLEVQATSLRSHYEYKKDGKSITVLVNPGDFGGGGDGDAHFSINENKLQLDGSYQACNPEPDLTGVCRYGNGQLELMVTSPNTYEGNYYMFWLTDSFSENVEAYQQLAKIIETIELK